MITINPYLNFSGNTEEAFNLYRSVFGGEFTVVQRFQDVPGTEHLAAADRSKIMHISLPIGNGIVLMATDALEAMGHKLTFGNNFYININVDRKEEANRIFNQLSDGGKVEMPLAYTFWGAYFGSFADRFDVKWMINYEKKK